MTADLYVLACNAIENAKLLLSSGMPNENDLIGRNLMDHPYVLAWALMPDNVGAYRGPSSTSGVEVLRDGAFRSERAAFRMDVDNWGWDFATSSPGSDVEEAVAEGFFGTALRERIADTVPRQFHIGFLYEQLPSPGNRCTSTRPTWTRSGSHAPGSSTTSTTTPGRGWLPPTSSGISCSRCWGQPTDTEYSSSDPGYLTYAGQPYIFIGAGHNVGTHRMGPKAESSVVNSFQRCWAHENLYLAGCGSMPTIATANPSLTMAALTFRTAESILDDLGIR